MVGNLVESTDRRMALAILPLIVIGASFAYLAYGDYSHYSASNTAIQGEIVSYLNKTLELRLTLSLSRIQINSGEQIGVYVTEYNMLPIHHHLVANLSLPLQAMATELSCGWINDPIGFAVFQRYYATDNASSAPPLPLDKPVVGPHSCFAVPVGVRAYDFEPLSDVIYGKCGEELCSGSLRTEGSPSGYWVAGTTPNANHVYLHSFDPESIQS